MELKQNPWDKWGFTGNPFDTGALSLCSRLLPISQAFVGRSLDSPEAQQLLNIIRNPGGGRGIVEGEVGVGKTTFVNYQRYLWEYEAEDRLLTTLREIPVYSNWQAKDFLREILGHLSHKLLSLCEQKGRKSSALLKKLSLLNQIFYHESLNLQGSLCGIGIGYSQQPHLNVPDMTESQLVNYLIELIAEVRNMGYHGVFLHFDNLELMATEDYRHCRRLFEEIRDILQLPDIYYIFVAKKGFYSEVIAPAQRVSSIMGWPVNIPPLSCEEVIMAISTRYRLLALKPGHEIPPVNDEVIRRLYALYEGKIRFIMDAVAQIVLNHCSPDTDTLSAKKAEEIFANLVYYRTRSLTDKEFQALQAILPLNEFTNQHLVQVLTMQKTNVSALLKKLCQENFIYLSRREGRHLYYRARDEFKILLQRKPQKFARPSMPQGRVRIGQREQCLVAHLKQHHTITNRKYQQLMGVSAATARRDLADFVQHKLIIQQGAGRATSYQLVPE
jgi:DNA-binding MarR family transcriptional regulator